MRQNVPLSVKPALILSHVSISSSAAPNPRQDQRGRNIRVLSEAQGKQQANVGGQGKNYQRNGGGTQGVFQRDARLTTAVPGGTSTVFTGK